MTDPLTPEEDAADSLGSYNDAMRAIGERVKGGAPVPAFLQGRLHNRDQAALEIGALYRVARSSAIESVHHLIEAGQRLAEKKASLGHGEWLPWLEANYDVLGFETRQTAAKLIKAASVKCNVDVPLDEADAVQINRMIWGNAPVRGTAGTGDNEWFTPAQYIAAAREVMGGIDLDPATHPLAQETVQATSCFTADNDGLEQQWLGRVWLNPPYAQPLIAQFIEKLVGEVSTRHVEQAILLTHNYTDTAWFHQAEASADLICFTRGRIKFVDADGDECAPTQGQAFFYYGAHADLFREVFSRFGFVR